MDNISKTREELIEDLSRLKKDLDSLKISYAKFKEYQEVLKKSEELYKLIAEYAEEFIFIIDNKMCIQYINNFASSFFNQTSSQMIGKHLSEIFSSGVFEMQRAHLRSVFETGKSFMGEDQIDFPKESLWLSTRLIPFKDEDGSVYAVMGISRDITNKKTSEDIVKKSELQFRQLIDQAADPMFVHDLDGNILACNKQACLNLGYTEEELLGLNVRDVEMKFKIMELSKFFDKLQEGPITMQGVHKRKDGSLYPVDIRFGIVEFRGSKLIIEFARDITERKAQEEIIFKREYQLEVLRRTSIHLNAILEIPVILRNLVASSMEIIGAEGGMGGVFENGKIIYKEYNKKGRLQNINYAFGPGEGATGRIIDSLKPYFSNDALNDKYIIPEVRNALNVSNFAMVPILSGKGELLGAIEVQNKELGKPFVSEDIMILQSLAASAAPAIENTKYLIERIEKEKTLREERDKAQKYLDIAANMFLVLNSNQEVLLINKKGCEILGYDENELSGRNFFDTVIPEDIRADMKNAFSGLLTGKEGPFEYIESSVLTKNREEKIISWHNTVLRDEKGNVVSTLSSGEDVTDKLKTQEDLAYSERFLSNIFTSIQDGISVLDNSLNIIRVNPAMEKWYAHSMPLLGKKCYEVYHHRETPCETCPTKISLETKKSAYETVPKVGSDGRITGWFDLYSFPMIDEETGDLKGVIEYVRDISEKKLAEEALKKSESEYRTTIDSMADIIHVVDRDLNIVLANDTLKHVNEKLGFITDVLGKNIFEVFPFMNDKVRIQYQKVFEVGKVLVTEEESDLGDTTFITETRKIPIFENGQVTRVLTIVRDITAKKSAERRLEKLNKELAKSNRRLKQIALRDPQTGLFNHNYLLEIIDPEYYRAKRYVHPLSVIMIDLDYFKSINEVYGHQFGDLVLKQFSKQLKTMVRSYDIVIRYSGEEFVIVSPNINKEKALILAHRLLESMNLYNFGNHKQTVKIKLSVAVASYPEDKAEKGMDLINLADKILNKAKEEGGNRVYSSKEAKEKKKESVYEFNEKAQDVEFLKDEISKLTKKGNQSVIESISAFAKTIELKDHYTGEHVEKTVLYATKIASSLGLSDDEIKYIKQAAVIHDLGKIGISEKILKKPAKLTKIEFKEIKKHPQIGVDIIRPIQFMHEIIPLILYHHERWDGLGYPAGLKGEEIPMGARIISVADAYHAITSDRPYRKAYSKAEAVKIIKNGSGMQFDPKVVNVFLKILRQEK